MVHKRYGVIAVVEQHEKLLVIRRSELVIAPGTLCFPGGGIENGETPKQALIREFREELGETIIPGHEIWQSVTPWDVHLRWWTGKLPEKFELKANFQEVAEIDWMILDELKCHPDLLSSNLPFLEFFAHYRKSCI